MKEDENNKKNILVIGATGLVGVSVIKTLLEKGFRVHATSNDQKGISTLEFEFMDDYSAGNILYYYGFNPYSFNSFARFRDVWASDGCFKFSGMVFCVALGSQLGFMEEINLSLDGLTQGMWNGTIEKFLHYFVLCCVHLNPCMFRDSDIVFISSSIANLLDESVPQWMTVAHHNQLKESLDKFISEMKSNGVVGGERTVIHRIGIKAKRLFMSEEISTSQIPQDSPVGDDISRAISDIFCDDEYVNYDFCYTNYGIHKMAGGDDE